MTGISSDHKAIAKSALQALGGKPRVARYWDDRNTTSIDILSTAGRAYDGITTYSTIGLSDYSMAQTPDGESVGIEIVGVGASVFEHYPNVVATCAFCIMNSEYSISYGSVFRDVVEMYAPSGDMKHVLFVSPFLWGALRVLELESKKVTWLLAVPISEQEYRYAQENGIESLEELFEREEIDIFDMERKSRL